MARVFKAAGRCPRHVGQGSTVQNWNEATNLVITGQAGGQIMGDWAQGEFAGGRTGRGHRLRMPARPRRDRGARDRAATPSTSRCSTTGNQIAAQDRAGQALLSPTVQVAFNLKKGSLPVRGDIDLAAANDCMQKGLALLADGKLLPDTNQLTHRTRRTS
jgi:glucose/mannose transport system substrate-binding protein